MFLFLATWPIELLHIKITTSIAYPTFTSKKCKKPRANYSADPPNPTLPSQLQFHNAIINQTPRTTKKKSPPLPRRIRDTLHTQHPHPHRLRPRRRAPRSSRRRHRKARRPQQTLQTTIRATISTKPELRQSDWPGCAAMVVQHHPRHFYSFPRTRSKLPARPCNGIASPLFFERGV